MICWGCYIHSMVDPQQQVACGSLDPRTCHSLDPRLQMNCGLSAWCACTMPSQSMYPPPPDTPHDTQYHTNNRGIMGDVHRLLHKLCTSQVLGCSVPRSSYGHKVVRISSKGETMLDLTHCALVTSYDDLGQHWLRYWLVAWRHQAITWTNVDLSSIRSCGIHLRTLSWEDLKIPYSKARLKIMFLKSQ